MILSDNQLVRLWRLVKNEDLDGIAAELDEANGIGHVSDTLRSLSDRSIRNLCELVHQELREREAE